MSIFILLITIILILIKYLRFILNEIVQLIKTNLVPLLSKQYYYFFFNIIINNQVGIQF